MATEREEPPSEEELLLEALRKKADAFSNREWEAYWLKEGPSLLTHGWAASHPDIPLDKLSEVCSLEFISSAIKTLSLESCSRSHEAGGEEDEYSTESILAVSSGREEGVKVTCMAETQLDLEMEVSSEGAAIPTEPMAVSEEVASSNDTNLQLVGSETVTDAANGEGPTDEATLSSEAIVALWNEHYNSYYWYIYEMFVREQKGEQQQQQQLPPGEEEEEGGEGEEIESQDSEAMGEPQSAEVRWSECVYKANLILC